MRGSPPGEGDPYAGLEPAGLWSHFARITRIPRPSGQEGEIISHLLAWAERAGFAARQDAFGNLCVYVPPSPGAVASPPIALQAHLDMVCVREDGASGDPARGQIVVVRDGDWIRADRTTLGADNGIAIAAMLHLAESADALHGPLELLFTVQEETTSGGADALDPTLLRSRTLLNLDSEEDGVLVIGAAGGIWSVVRWRAPMEPLPSGWDAVEIAVSGLQGGHSGSDISKHRLNAIRGLLRVLLAAAEATPLSLCAAKGGDAFNAIPREARAVVSTSQADAERLRAAVERMREDLTREFLSSEPGLTITAAPPVIAPTLGYSPADSRKWIDMASIFPCGVLAMDPRFPGHVETSSSVGVIGVDGETLAVESFTRSSVTPAMHDVVESIRAAARLGGAQFSVVPPEGPCWEVDPASPALAAARAAYHRMFGAEPRQEAVHGFLEASLIRKQIPGLDIVSFGPEIRDAHKPGERVHIASVGRFCRFLSSIVRDLTSQSPAP
jgi:dipeptidase D